MRLQRHLALVGAQRGQGADEGVLDDLLGVVVRAAEQAAGEGQQALVVAVVDRVEGAVVAERTSSTSCSSVAAR